MSYFEIGIYQPRNGINVGTLWRSAYQLGAAGIFTIGRPFKRQSSDTSAAHLHIPFRTYDSFEEFISDRPMGAVLVGVEIGGTPLAQFRHPEQAVYLLGSEDNGLPPRVVACCNQVVALESVNKASYNLAVAGSILMYHRIFASPTH